MTDNRFGYMRKHLGISQKEASEIFNTRLDTIKKWDSGRINVPVPVLEEMFDLVRLTRDLIEEVVLEYRARDNEDPIDEIYLHMPDPETMVSYDLPKSSGWVERVIGGIIGELAEFHVYAASEIPEHYGVGFQWYELWEWSFGELAASLGLIVIENEDAFTKDIEKTLASESFKVRYDPQSKDYFLGFATTCINNKTHVIWIKGCSGGRYADDLVGNFDLSFFSNSDSDLPFIKAENGFEESVGLATGSNGETEDRSSDVYSLAELIFAKLAERYKTNADLLAACRKIDKQQLGDFDADGEVHEDHLINWGLRDKKLLSHNFLASLFSAVQKETGNFLYPEALIEISDIIRRSEPVMNDVDHQCLVVDLENIEVTVFLDLRDLIDADKDGKRHSEEVSKAIEIIKTAMDGDKIATIPAFSEISVQAGSD